VAVSGSYAYVADNDSGLRVISVVDAAHPVEVGYCDAPSAAFGVAVSGDYAYVTGIHYGMWVMSVADPAHPVAVGSCGLSGEAYGIAASGGCVHVANDVAGLRIISVADPALPDEVGYYRTGFARSVFVCGDYTYVMDYLGGLQILQFYGGGVEEAPKAGVRTAGPIPTVVRGVLDLQVGSRQQAVDRAELLDAAGRRVMNLQAGANDVSRLAPGVYFIREAQAKSVRKVVIQR
jgi:hypothetical protein